MHTIMLMNAKGGCGKTTLATNIATWLADEGSRVTLADFDPQGSTLDWLKAREDYDGIPKIQGIDATREAITAAKAKNIDHLIMDAPASTHGKVINTLIRRVDSLIIPLLPSPIDIRACKRFLEELMDSGRVSRKQTRIAIVVNRARENTLIYKQLDEYLGHLEIPVLAHLRESQNYIRSAERGLGLFEMAPSMVWQDVELWDPIFEWINQK